MAELAFRPGLPIAYDLGFTALSVVVAVLVSGLGLAIALGRSTYSAALGGVVVGLGVAAMHYTGMAALRLPAVAQWDINYVIASLVVSAVFSSLAMIAARTRSDVLGRFQATGLLVLAIVGLHFTGMAAVTFFPDPTIVIPDQAISPEWLAIAIAAITILIVGLGLVGSNVDQHLAERSALEAARLREHVAALEAAKLELSSALASAAAANQAKSQFLSTISHELRTPLNAIIGFSEILNAEAFGQVGNVRYRSYQDDILQSAKHLLGLINDILDMTKLDADAFNLREDVIDPKETIAQCVHSDAIAGGAEATSSSPRSTATSAPAGRREGLRQILLNLLSNAVKFTPSGGTVSASASVHDGGLRIVIADTGIGMRHEDLPRALESFGQIDSTLARRYDGHGVGAAAGQAPHRIAWRHAQDREHHRRRHTVTVSLPPDRLCPERQAA